MCRFLYSLLLIGALTPGIASETRPPRLYRDQVQPHWFAGNNRFWYRVQVASNAHEFVLVEAEKGLRQPAFDGPRLAKALAGAGVTNAVAERLPLDDLEFDDTLGSARLAA